MDKNSIVYVTVTKLPLARLNNDEHFQFHTEIIRQINETKPEALFIASQFKDYTEIFEQEDHALKKLVKSIYTDVIHDENYKRGDIFKGMTAANDAMLLHFTEEVRSSAKRLKIVSNNYGKINRKPINEQTSAITNILQDLKGRFAADVAKVGIGGWITELEKQNIVVSNLVEERYNEDNQKSDLIMKKARVNTDDIYKYIMKYMESMCLTCQMEKNIYKEFIHKVNVIVDKYKNILAQRIGRAKDKKDNIDNDNNDNNDKI